MTGATAPAVGAKPAGATGPAAVAAPAMGHATGNCACAWELKIAKQDSNNVLMDRIKPGEDLMCMEWSEQ